MHPQVIRAFHDEMEKIAISSALMGSLIGTGVGAASGAILAVLRNRKLEKKDRKYLQDIITGMGVGGSLGGLIGSTHAEIKSATFRATLDHLKNRFPQVHTDPAIMDHMWEKAVEAHRF